MTTPGVSRAMGPEFPGCRLPTGGWNGVMKVGRQTTLRDQAVLQGIGVHSGLPVTLTLHPAEANSGLRFIRCGYGGGRDREVCAEIGAVTATEFATVLGDASGPLISTAEHVLAALRGLGVEIGRASGR